MKQRFQYLLSGESCKQTSLSFYVVLIGLFVLGLCHWISFLNAGDLSLTAYDWPKERVYYELYQEAFQNKTVPYHSSLELQGTHRFLAVPETIFSPQLILLKWISVGEFVLAQTLILYLAGFIGCVCLARRYGLSLFSFSILFFLFNFNGYLTAHLSVGHFMWSSLFLLPYFVLFVLKMVEDKEDSSVIYEIPLFLFFVLLQGGVHFFQWSILFLVLYWVFNQGDSIRLCWILVFSFLLGAVRIFPAMLAFWKYDSFFLSGYPTLIDLLKAMVVIQDHLAEQIGSVFSRLGWWEYDLYITLPGFLFIAYFGVYLRLKQKKSKSKLKYAALDAPIWGLVLLSLSYLYLPLSRLPIPLLNSERVSSRFIILPLIFLLVLALLRFQNWINKKKKISFAWIAGAYSILVISILSLMHHSYLWRLLLIEKEHLSQYTKITSQITFVEDPFYKALLSIGALITCATLGWIVWKGCYEKRKDQS